MTINLKLRDATSTKTETLRRRFYPPTPRLDELNKPKPILVGYSVETHGISFEVNPDVLARTVHSIFADEQLRLQIRQKTALYLVAPYAYAEGLYASTVLSDAEVVLQYWLHKVVPSAQGHPRLPNDADVDLILEYWQAHWNVRKSEAADFQKRLTSKFLTAVGSAIEKAFKNTQTFRDFSLSLVLHSLATLLKKLVGRLGGVGSEALVAYADIPLLGNVDRVAVPRILIMDTVQGGSGGVAQAFERLDLTTNEGSLWWMLQIELGRCPVSSGEEFVRTFLSQATEAQIKHVQQQKTTQALHNTIEQLQLSPVPEAIPILGRILFSETTVSNNKINPACIIKELLDIEKKYNSTSVIKHSNEAIVCLAVASLSTTTLPNISELKEALRQDNVTENLDYELSLQLMTLFEKVCFDGCPVCLGSGSDIEHFHIAHLLNSRQALLKLREVLLESLRKGTCIAELSEALLNNEPVRIEGNPGGLGNQINAPGGVAIITQTSQDGQVTGASVVVNNPQNTEAFFRKQDGWTNQWDGPTHRTYKTKDGTWVRSQGEVIIADWLYSQKIAYEYEQPLLYKDEEGKTKRIHPDFFLYEDDIYIEYWGRDDAEYIEKREFKENLYKNHPKLKEIKVLSIEKNEVYSDIFIKKIKEFRSK